MNTTNTLSGSPAGTLTGNAVGNAADRAHQTVDRAADRAAPVLERAASAAHRGIDKAADVAAPAAEWVNESRKELAARSNELADAASGYIRARPLVAVAGALAIGYFAGKLLR